jgi:sugar lactone lactonase YvrE
MSEPKGREPEGRGPELAWEVAVPARAELAEHPVWDAARACLIWVDINAGQVHQFRPEAGNEDAGDEILADVGVAVGAAIPRRAGGYVLAAADGFRLTAADGSPAAGPLRPPGMPGDVRFNDGACDQAGRFWAGTVALDVRAGAGSLYRLDPDGSVALVFDGVTESNGLGWSPHGETFYYIDSGEPEPRVRAFAHDPATGELSGERDLVRFGPADGIPDGLAIDAAGCLWIAMWQGGCVRRYTAAGELLGIFPVPVTQPTCPGFAGRDLDQLYLTSAWQGMDAAQLAAEPLAGHVLRARPGVTGLPAGNYGG